MPAATVTAPAASVSVAEPAASVHASVVDAGVAVVDAGDAKSVSREVRVSSRSDDPNSSPLAMFDGDDATSWSPATGDAAPTIAFELERPKTKVHALLLATTGVLEVKVTWKPRADVTNPDTHVTYVGYGAEQTLAERVALQTSTGLQRVAIETAGQGIVTLTILKQTSGTVPAVRELRLETDDGTVLRPKWMVVGDDKPRGISGIVPEHPLVLECVAAVNDSPRAYCFSGVWNSAMPAFGRTAFVMIDASGAHVLRTLTFDFVRDVRDEPQAHLRWADWLAIEKTLREAGAVTLEKRRAKFPAGAIEVPWGKTASAFGATLRLRETSASPDSFAPEPGGVRRSGVLEIRWPGAAGFSTVMSDAIGPALGGAIAFARPLGTAWLIERIGWSERTPGSNASETVSDYAASELGDAILCDPTTKKCTPPYSAFP